MPAGSVDDYLTALPADRREALQKVRATIRIAAPDAAESIAYGMPAYKHRGKPLIYFGAAKAHLAIYGNSLRLVPEWTDRLAGRSMSKGSIHFTPDDPLPDGLIEAIVKARLAEIED